MHFTSFFCSFQLHQWISCHGNGSVCMQSQRLFTPESGAANNQEVEEAWCFAGRASWWTVVAGELTAKAFSVPCRGILLSGLYIISFNTEFYWRRGRKKLANKLCVSLVANRTTSHSLFRRRWWLSASHSSLTEQFIVRQREVKQKWMVPHR